ncbi:uncharacterized protein M421DRAFT_6413 [Didymella exigua CBS 183.55]|uniref:Uncharacterized protein n=1 Tax=Didymella exigua CBS 183.55 TaxID=1150837 RepID=A0A6A5RHH7_9PLEO|nr:uncharacterized protein M421DRAFT_6413 [Didymella exigua CBS 183.55]KAF1927222.1 hypothetical protein M421DRAFT_6413 [Didymella exigua CBS 183.55]
MNSMTKDVLLARTQEALNRNEFDDITAEIQLFEMYLQFMWNGKQTEIQLPRTLADQVQLQIDRARSIRPPNRKRSLERMDASSTNVRNQRPRTSAAADEIEEVVCLTDDDSDSSQGPISDQLLALERNTKLPDARASAEWRRLVTEHQDFVRMNALKSMQGSYVIKCSEVEDRWPEHAASLTLDIADSHGLERRGLRGHSDLGPIRGELVLATNATKLAWSEAAMRCAGLLPVYEDTPDAELQSTNDRTYLAFKMIVASGSKLRGFTGSGELFFNNVSCTAFRGTISLPLQQNAEPTQLHLDGYKISDVARRRPPPESFSLFRLENDSSG